MRLAYPNITQLKGQVVGISTDTPDSLQQLHKQMALPFALASDPGHQVIDRYAGIEVKGSPESKPHARPAVFVIDRAGIVRWSYVGKSPVDRPETIAILDALYKAP